MKKIVPELFLIASIVLIGVSCYMLWGIGKSLLVLGAYLGFIAFVLVYERAKE